MSQINKIKIKNKINLGWIYVVNVVPVTEKKHLHTWKNSIFRAEILDTSCSNSTSHPGKFQNPHPTKARLKFCTSRRPFVSNSLHTSRLRQITVGCSAGDVRGRGVRKLRIDERIAARILMSWNGQMLSKYRSLCSRLWFFQFMRKNTWWV